MPNITPQDGLVYIATQVNSFYPTWLIGLFASNYTPTAADVLATYTAIEATFPGYAQQPLLAPSTPTIDVFGNAVATFPNVTFTCTSPPGSPETEYGWFLYDSSTGALLAAGTFGTAQVISTTGDQVILQPSDVTEPG